MTREEFVIVPFQLLSSKQNVATREHHRAGSDMWAIVEKATRRTFTYCYTKQSDAEQVLDNMLSHLDHSKVACNFRLGVDHCIPTTPSAFRL